MALAAVLAAACATLPAQKPAVTAFGSFTYSLAGSGSPAVVFESGLGDGREAWRPVFNALSKTTAVFAYDRGGYGGSKALSDDRSGEQVVAELRGLLRAAGVAPPYVLVGHSLGGLYVELFAREHADEVAGVVLVDSRPADFSGRCKAAKAMVCKPPGWLMLFVGGGSMAEYKAAPRTMRQVLQAPAFPPVPLTVVTGTDKPFEGPTFNRLWLETQAELSRLSPDGRHVVCDHCGHYVHEDDPKLVVDAIRDVVNRSRSTMQ